MLSRREFLATTAAVAMARPTFSDAALLPRGLRFAIQTGSLERTAGCRVIDQLRRAGELGYPAFLDPQLLQRTDQEADELRQAAARLDIELGPVDGPAFHRPEDFLIRPSGPNLIEAFAKAQRFGITAVRCPVGPAMMEVSKEILAVWSIAATTAVNHRQVLLLEPWDDGRVGRAVFEHCAAVVVRLADPGVRLSLNVEQLRATGASVAEFVTRYRSFIGHVEMQLFQGNEDVLEALLLANYTGLIAIRRSVDYQEPRPSGRGFLVEREPAS